MRTQRNSLNISDLEACKPGSWSLDGTTPCTFCPKGTYQDAYGGMDCNVCQHALTTELDGASNFSECQGN